MQLFQEQDFLNLNLPNALTEELLQKSNNISQLVYKSYQHLSDYKENLRNKMLKDFLILNETEILINDNIPTSCGVDGSNAIKSLLSMDLVGCAAVAVEGLAPPYELGIWEKPYHKIFIRTINRDMSNKTIIRAIMFGYELELACRAPHQVVFIDGSIFTPFVSFNLGINVFFKQSTKSISTRTYREY